MAFSFIFLMIRCGVSIKQFRPGEKLPWPRHPVAWINISSITKSHHHGENQETESPLYVVAGSHNVQMETKEGLHEVVATDLNLQQTVGDMFVRAFGEIFSFAPYRNGVRSTLAAKGWHP